MSQLYNCPDCPVKDKPYFGNPCDSCWRTNNKFNNYEYKLIKYEKPNPCAKCPNNPVNGGSGICLCTLGSQFTITC